MSTRKTITLAEKLKLISRYAQIKKDEGNVNVSKLATEYGMRVSTILKNREMIGQEAEEAKSFVGGDMKRLFKLRFFFFSEPSNQYKGSDILLFFFLTRSYHKSMNVLKVGVSNVLKRQFQD